MTFLVLLVFSYNVAFLFVGTASLGLFLSSTFPSMLAYTEDILQYKGGCAGAQSHERPPAPAPVFLRYIPAPSLPCALPRNARTPPDPAGNRFPGGPLLTHVAFPIQLSTCVT